MSCIKRNIDQGPGKPIGSLTADPKEIDQILRHAWATITNGNVTDLEAAVSVFWDQYGGFCHRAEEWQVGELTVEDFKAVCTADTESAAGLDGWAARDIALLSDKALGLIVKLLNAVEKGASWPEHMLHTRAVFLSKDSEKTEDPLAYRILKITSGWYRKWATCRVKNLEPWIKTWDNKYNNSGVPGKGAQDAWYQTALKVELDSISGCHTSGGSIDIFKCFDQINREFIYALCVEAGLPTRILLPYFAYIDNMRIRYQVGKTIGSEHQDLCSLPQGCLSR